MRVIIAPDSFKGVLDAGRAARALAAGVRQARPQADIVCVPMADGGEGTLDVLVNASGGTRRKVTAHGPLGDPIEVPVGLIRQASTAVVELATVAGYGLVPADRRDPMKTSTYGLGEVIRAVIEGQIEEIILAIGGSASVDGGTGMMQALGLTLLDNDGRVIPIRAAGGDLLGIHRFSWIDRPDNIDNVQFTIACDVLNPACGPDGAAAVFGPQKGANTTQVGLLDRGMARWVTLLEQACGRSIRMEPGTGAAGGVALPMLALMNAAIVPGVDLISEVVGLARLIDSSDLIITGEGRVDRQSLMGKVVGAVARMARGAGVPCVAIAGATGEGADQCLDVLDRIETLGGPLAETESRLAQAAFHLASQML